MENLNSLKRKQRQSRDAEKQDGYEAYEHHHIITSLFCSKFIMLP